MKFFLETVFRIAIIVSAVLFCQTEILGQTQKSPDKQTKQEIFWINSFRWDNLEPSLVETKLDSVIESSESNEDKRLYWYAMAYKKLFGSVTTENPQGKEHRFDALMDFLKDCPESEVKANFWYLNAMFCLEKRKFDDGFKWLFLAKAEFESIGYDQLSGAGEYLNGIGLYYYIFEDYRNAAKYLEQAGEYPFYTERGAISSRNTLGMAYQKTKAFKNAEKAFMATIQLAEKSRDSVYIGMGTGNYGNTLRLAGKAKESLPYLYKDYQINLTKEPGSSAITSIYIARALLSLDSTAAARRFIDISVPLSRKITNISLSSYPLNYYEAQADYFEKIGNERMASIYLDSTIALRDSLSLVFNRKILSINQSTIEAERYQARLLNSEAEKSAAVTLRNIIIVFMLVLAIGGFYVYNQKQQKLLAEKKLREDQKKHAESLLAGATEQLKQYVKSITEKNDLINGINEELERLKSLSENTEEDREQIVEQRESLIKSVILTEKDWIQFRRLFERVYPDFLNIIKIRYPDLSAAETRLLVLLKLEVSNKEMAFILGVSIDAIRKSRQRLRKKLEQTAPGIELESLVAQL